jgi:4-amino-4-deoxy-L-arabinose transferase-like glycosyltransferase
MVDLAERMPATLELERGRSLSIARLNLYAVRTWPVARQFMLVLVAVFLVKQAINVVIFPPFSGHDEVAHYAYVRVVATQYRVPKIPDLQVFRDGLQNGTALSSGDFIPNDLFRYCRYVLDWGYCDDPRWKASPPHIVTFEGEYYPYGWQYAANHPPLYYLYLAPIYRLTDRFSPAIQQYIFRAATIPFGLAVVLLAYLIARTLFPGDQFLAITIPAFVAFQPQISYEASMVNNDIVSIAFFSLLLYLLVYGLRRGFTYRLAAIIGFSAGVGLLAKSTTLAALPLIAFAMILGCGIRNVKRWIPLGAVSAAITGAVCWPWYLYLHRTYGNFSGLDQIATLQYSYTYRGQTPPTIVGQLFDKAFALLRWKETWGEFGWRLIHLSDGLLLAIGIPCAVGVVGFLIYVAVSGLSRGTIRIGGERGIVIAPPARWQWIGIATLVLAALISYGAMLQFGTRFVLTQARYFFPAIIAYATIIMLGLRTVIPVSWHRYGQAAIVAALILLNVLIYTQYVIPYWYLGS